MQSPGHPCHRPRDGIASQIRARQPDLYIFPVKIEAPTLAKMPMTDTTATTHDEATRQRALDRYHVLDSLPEAAYDDIVQLASSLCGTPAALITLIDRDRQWFKAKTGFDGTETSRSVAVCDHAIRKPGQLMEIPDLSQDARFSSNPYVNGEEGATRFYASMPLVTPEGSAIGTVCVLDDKPRALDDTQRNALQSLARLTMTLLEARVRERSLEHESFIAHTAAGLVNAAPAETGPRTQQHPGYLLALIELQDHAGTVARLGERTTDKLLQRLDDVLEQTLAVGDDAITRSSGSTEFVAVLHGEHAPQTLELLRAAIDHEANAHGLQFLYGVAHGDPTESTGQVFLRADADLIDRKGAPAAV